MTYETAAQPDSLAWSGQDNQAGGAHRVEIAPASAGHHANAAQRAGIMNRAAHVIRAELPRVVIVIVRVIAKETPFRLHSRPVMTAWCKELALVLALTVMPLQGVAATLSILLCHGEAQAHAMHDQGSHDHGVPHDNHQDEGSTTGNSAYHLCCNVTASVPSIVTLPATQPDFPARAFAPDSLHDLFIPDRPQRPPLV